MVFLHFIFWQRYNKGITSACGKLDHLSGYNLDFYNEIHNYLLTILELISPLNKGVQPQ